MPIITRRVCEMESKLDLRRRISTHLAQPLSRNGEVRLTHRVNGAGEWYRTIDLRFTNSIDYRGIVFHDTLPR